MTGGHKIRSIDAAGEIADEIPLPEPDGDPVETGGEDEYPAWEEDWEESSSTYEKNWIFPALASLLLLAWTGFFLWANRATMFAPATPQQWVDWIGQWSLPVAIILAAWILIQRNSTREANRYAQAASALSNESAQLEERLTAVNRELSMAREFLSSQGLELESFGRIASERLSEHAEHLQSLVQSNGAQVEQIATVSTTAVENMGKLRDDLPVIANSARDVANQIGNAGTTAEDQIGMLASGFERLNQFGQASAKQVNALSEKVDATLAAFEAQAAKMSDVTTTRFATLREESDKFRAEMDGREVESLAAMRRRAEQLAEELSSSRGSLDEHEEEALKSMRSRLSGLRAESETIARSIREGEEEAKALWIVQIESMKERLLGAVEQIKENDQRALEMANRQLAELREESIRVDAQLAERHTRFSSQLVERREAIDASEREALDRLTHQLDVIDSELDDRRKKQVEHATALQESTEAATTQVGELTAQMEALVERSRDAQQDMIGTTSSMAENLAASREDMIATQSIVEDMTEACVRLLELIQASAQHSKSELPEAIAIAEERLAEARQSSEALGVLLSESLSRSESISNYMISANEGGEALQLRTDEMQTRLHGLSAAYGEEIEALRGALTSLENDGEAVTEASAGALRNAIDGLQDKVREALALAGKESSDTIDVIAKGIAARSADAIDRAVREQSDSAIAELEEAATRSSTSAREAALQLRDQLALVNELTGNLENRVALARERAHEQVDNDFARRVALITEALNSNAIDIAKSLSTDVTDTAWASYLRGDRGIFTRRAVSLLSNTEAREIAELYDVDHEFRDHVSRYIADFEAMLRTMLSTRDGNAIGVTLLSSDMGKLYVAMAQAIERLRDE